MTAEGLAATGGFVLMVVFAYFPVVGNWFNGLASDRKKLLMAGLLILTAAVIYGLECAGWYDTSGVICSMAGFWAFGKILLIAVVSNQATFALAPAVGNNVSTDDPIWVQKYEARQGSGKPKKTWTNPKDK